MVAGATARFLRTESSGPVTFVVTGDGGRAAEDLACAEYIGRSLAGCDAEAAPYLHRARNPWAAADLNGRTKWLAASPRVDETVGRPGLRAITR
ncbi:hypothetical protein GCM10014715_08810 [Streptomyces spiralis]|uniref:2-phosphosulfolactate phosphatase n=1 Tax=Streptomyces spiralis TaxID=66376 RepID=A0A919DMR0_9ACTN|nr:hypothetical protein GCM10014715_08810 [Streptomyces spiralis]